MNYPLVKLIVAQMATKRMVLQMVTVTPVGEELDSIAVGGQDTEIGPHRHRMEGDSVPDPSRMRFLMTLPPPPGLGLPVVKRGGPRAGADAAGPGICSARAHALG